MSYCPTCQLPFIDEDVLKQAIQRWGNVPQMLMAVEEGAELSQALLHFIRGRSSKSEVAGEIADVLIMAHQMRLIFDPRVVDELVKFKMERLEERLGE